jgi:hypothetical protein
LGFSVDETSADWTVCGTFRGGFLPSQAILFLEIYIGNDELLTANCERSKGECDE